MAFASAISFLTPMILLGLITLPLIWWLLRATPPAPNQVRFPAFIVLARLTNREETPQRTPWWLLLLRLLLAGLIIVALAGPVLNAPESQDNDGPVVLVIDNTYAAAPGWSLRKTMMETIAQETRQINRPVFVLTTAPSFPIGSQTLFGPLSAEDLMTLAGTLEPLSFRADRINAQQTLQQLDEALQRSSNNSAFKGEPNFLWLNDNHSAEDAKTDKQFLSALQERGQVRVIIDTQRPAFALTKNTGRGEISEKNTPETKGSSFTIRRLTKEDAWQGSLVALARDGRVLERVDLSLGTGQNQTQGLINLPIALQNDLASVRIDTIRSSASLWLADARDRRALIGLLRDSQDQSQALLSGNHYIREALAQFAQFQVGTIETLTQSDVSVIVLNDIGRMRDEDVDRLTDWVERGGVLIRFAGPNLADAALDAPPPLLPIELRRGERAFGGALTWDTPQPIGPFNLEGPFADLIVPDDIFIRQQILAQPGGQTSESTWASLKDGTPLVTGAQSGDGLKVLFHITATPVWSDLPLSEIFIDILRKLTFLSTLGPNTLEETISDNNQVRYTPLRSLDGYGQLQRPAPGLTGITLAQANAPATPQSPPGLYGSNDTPLVLNAITAQESFEPIALGPVTITPYEEKPPVQLWAYLFVAAFIAFLLDMLATLFLGGKLGRFGQTSQNQESKSNPAKKPVPGNIAALIIAGLMIGLFALPDAHAQTKTDNPGANKTATQSVSKTKPLDPEIDKQVSDATLRARFAYVRTGNARIDEITNSGLTSLSQELSRRTTVSPAAPVAIDILTDDFSVYPILYWPILAGSALPPDHVLAEVENYMRLGGLVIFDTRDEERIVPGQETPEAVILRKLLSRINIPPLIPVRANHVLYRSYYLLPELRGRTGFHDVWVAAGSSSNDGVTSLIIGGRDWVGAWARNDFGSPLRPIINNKYSNGERAREMAYRSGINMAMVAFTGNYKTDQVHTKVLLKRLGEAAP